MDSMYGGGKPAAAVAPPESGGDEKPGDENHEAEEKKSVDEENAGAAEILIAKKELPPETKEGDVCSFKVVKDFGDEYSLQYVKDDEKPPGPAGGDDGVSGELAELSSGSERNAD